MKLALRILKFQTKLGVQPEQTETENMLEQEEIMASVGTVVQKFDKKINKSLSTYFAILISLLCTSSRGPRKIILFSRLSSILQNLQKWGAHL